jgi:hypothetical protein
MITNPKIASSTLAKVNTYSFCSFMLSFFLLF